MDQVWVVGSWVLGEYEMVSVASTEEIADREAKRLAAENPGKVYSVSLFVKHEKPS